MTTPITPGIVNLLQNVPVTGANQLPPIESRDYGLQFVAGATFVDPETSQTIESGEIYEWFNGQWQAYSSGGGGSGNVVGPTGSSPNEICTYISDTAIGKNGSTTLVADTFTPASASSTFSKQFIFAQYSPTTVSGSSLTLSTTNSGKAFYITNANCSISVSASASLNAFNHWYVLCAAGAAATFTFQAGDTAYGDANLEATEDCEVIFRGGTFFSIDPGYQTGGQGSGSVTSVAMTVPSWLQVSGSPITTAGTLAVTGASTAAHTFLAGPATGNAPPTMRTFALGDLPAQADDTILSNISGSSASPAANSLTNILDNAFTGTQGAILFRGASAWTYLAPGIDGQLLKTQGAAANPAWETVGGGSVDGPVSSTTNAIATWGDTTGELLENSTVLINSFGGMSGNFPAFSPSSSSTLTLNSTNVGQAIRLQSGSPTTVTLADASTQTPGAMWYLATNGATTVTFVKEVGADTIVGQTIMSALETVVVWYTTDAFFYVVPGLQSSGPASGDVVGPNGATLNTVPVFGDTTGKLLADSDLILTSAANLITLSSGSSALRLEPPINYDVQAYLSGTSKVEIINSASTELHFVATGGTYGTAIRQETGAPDGLEFVSTLNSDGSDVTTILQLERDGTVYIPSGNLVGSANGLYSISQFSREQVQISDSTLSLSPDNIGSYFTLSYAGTVTVTIGIGSSFNPGAFWGIKCETGTTANFVLAGSGAGDTLDGQTALSQTESCVINYYADHKFENTPGLQEVGPASGDVVGPSSAVSGDLAMFNGTTGKLIADSTLNVNNSGGVTYISVTNQLDLVPDSGRNLIIDLDGSCFAQIINSANAQLNFKNTGGTYGTAFKQVTGSPDSLQIFSTNNNDDSPYANIMNLANDGTITVNGGNVIGVSSNAMINFVEYTVPVVGSLLTLNNSNIGTTFALSSPAVTVTIADSIATGMTTGAWWGILASATTNVTFATSGSDIIIGNENTLGPTESCYIRLRTSGVFENDPRYQVFGPGAGDVVGPSSATDNAVTIFDGTSGKLIKSTGLSFSSNTLSCTTGSMFTVYAGPAQGLTLQTSTATAPSDVFISAGDSNGGGNNGGNVTITTGAGNAGGVGGAFSVTTGAIGTIRLDPTGGTIQLEGPAYFNENIVSGYNKLFTINSTSSYPLTAASTGASYYLTNAGTVTVTIPDSSTAVSGFNAEIYTSSATSVNFVLASGSDSIVGDTSMAPSQAYRIVRVAFTTIYQIQPILGANSGDVSGPGSGAAVGMIPAYGNTAGTLIGTSFFTMDGSEISSNTNSSTAYSAFAGQDLTLYTKDTTNPGNLFIMSGNSTGGAVGADIHITAGNGSGANAGGNIYITSGLGGTSDGQIVINGGQAGHTQILNVFKGDGSSTLTFGFLNWTQNLTGSTLTLDDTNEGKTIYCTNGSLTTLTIAASSTLSAGCFWRVKANSGTPVSFLLAGGSDSIDGPVNINSSCSVYIQYYGTIGPVGYFQISYEYNPAAVSGQLGVTDNHIVVYDGVSGTQVKNSALVIDATTGAITQTYDGDWFINGYAGRDVNVAATSGDVILSGDGITLGSTTIRIPAISSEAYNLIVTGAYNAGQVSLEKIGPTSNNGWVLTSNGTLTAPTFQPIPGTGLSNVTLTYTTGDWSGNTLTIPAVDIGFTVFASIQVYETGSAGTTFSQAPIFNMSKFDDGHIELYSGVSFNATVLIVGTP